MKAHKVMPNHACQAEMVARQITIDGAVELPGLFDPHAALALLNAIMSTRTFDYTLFMTKDEWDQSSKSHKHTNPGPNNNNLLMRFEDKLGFIENNKNFQDLMGSLLGQHYRLYLKKLVCRLPKCMLPDWAVCLIGDNPANTLNAFIRQEYRDMSYYYDVDLHQDIIEWPRQPEDQKEHRLLYMYVHLGEVTVDNSPLCFLMGSHKYGATPYQHDISMVDNNASQWKYHDPASDRTMICNLHPLVGGPGHGAIWHGCTLHGSHPAKTEKPRLALRYVLARDPDAPSCLLDQINSTIDGPLYLKANFNPGAVANPDGSYTLLHNDFTRQGRQGT